MGRTTGPPTITEAQVDADNTAKRAELLFLSEGAGTPEQKLRLMLSLDQELPSNEWLPLLTGYYLDGTLIYRPLTEGTFQAILQQFEQPTLLKLGKAGSSYINLRRQYDITQKLQKALWDLRHCGELSKLCVPRNCYFVTAEDRDWWNEYLFKLPERYRHPSEWDVWCMERIPSPPDLTTQQILHHVLPKDRLDRVMRFRKRNSKPSHIQIHLGRSTTERRFMSGFDDYPLSLDRLEELNPETALSIAKIMGAGLAVLHWVVKVSGRDVKFVLGGPRRHPLCGIDDGSDSSRRWQKSPGVNKFTKMTSYLWMFSFGKCTDIAPDSFGAWVAAQDFFSGQPYFPRPGCKGTFGGMVWAEFETAYLNTATEIFKKSWKDERGENVPTKLALQFLEEVKVLCAI